jgi:hypothetical protein
MGIKFTDIRQLSLFVFYSYQKVYCRPDHQEFNRHGNIRTGKSLFEQTQYYTHTGMKDHWEGDLRLRSYI